VPSAQTCCGQPAYNSGDRAGARDMARAVIDEFLPFDYTVVPSGSCGGMVSHHYPGCSPTTRHSAPRPTRWRPRPSS
jgi:L-lactate dehydrogenase complex protein LldE